MFENHLVCLVPHPLAFPPPSSVTKLNWGLGSRPGLQQKGDHGYALVAEGSDKRSNEPVRFPAAFPQTLGEWEGSDIYCTPEPQHYHTVHPPPAGTIVPVYRNMSPKPLAVLVDETGSENGAVL